MTRSNAMTGGILMNAGLKVFPCREYGAIKAPYISGGFKQATNKAATGVEWVGRFPKALWGIPCALNNAIVLDADRHGKGDGVANIMGLFSQHGFDYRVAPMVATPNDGYHFYFNRPANLGSTKASLCEAVDVRDNGYVIAPGCQLADGRWYRLVSGDLESFARAIVGQHLPDLPEWLMPMVTHQPTPRGRETSQLVAIDDAAIKNQLKGVIIAILNAVEGNRNRLLYWGACRLGEIVQAGWLDLETAELLLDEAGARIGLSPMETRRTAASGLRKILGGDYDAR